MESSFFEKLKKGMGTEEIADTEKEEKSSAPKITKQKKGFKKKKKSEIKTVSIELEEPEEPEKEKIIEKEKPKTKVLQKEEKWPEPEGQLAIDIYQTDSDLVIQSAIAGVKPENLDVAIEKDLLTIRGRRKKPSEEEGDYFSQECYWGSFSREIILPVEIDPGRVEASLTEGVLTIRIPKIERNKKRKIVIRG